MCNICSQWLGREIQWCNHEEGDYSVGTVVDVWVTPGKTTLAVVDHSTQAYSQVLPAFDHVFLYDMPEEVYAELPEIIRDEVRYALESGLECSAPGCEELRLFGARECSEHALGADEDSWPDFHDEWLPTMWAYNEAFYNGDMGQ